MRILSLVVLILTLSLGLSSAWLVRAIQVQNDATWQLLSQNERLKDNLATLKSLQSLSHGFYQDLTELDPGLPGLSTDQLVFHQGRVDEAILADDYPAVREGLALATETLVEVRQEQDRIVLDELRRREEAFNSSLVEAEKLFLDTSSWKARPEVVSEVRGSDKLSELEAWRGLQDELAQAIYLRRLASEQAIKSIVVRKKELKMYLYEDDRLIHSLSLSLGRSGYGTRSGQFKVLDKLGTVWGVWRIYLPYWMGIYWAGATENGIHGLPWDKAGTVYWQADVGKRNVTYGCVMGLDADIARVYNWAEIGTPVTIVD